MPSDDAQVLGSTSNPARPPPQDRPYAAPVRPHDTGRRPFSTARFIEAQAAFAEIARKTRNIP